MKMKKELFIRLLSGRRFKELKEDLMDRLDVDTSGNGAAKPIIMENDELMN